MISRIDLASLCAYDRRSSGWCSAACNWIRILELWIGELGQSQ